jgi:hypothetical protein
MAECGGVDDGVTFFYLCELGGKTATQAKVCIGVIPIEFGIVIAHDIVDLSGAATRTATGGLIASKKSRFSHSSHWP